MPLDFLGLLYGQRNLMLGIIIRIADIELWCACAVNPLIEKLLDVRMIRFVDGLDEIGGDDVLAAIDLEIVPQAAIKSIFANLLAKHVQHQATLAVSVVVKFAGVVEIVPHDWLAVQSGLGEPFVDCGPSIKVSLILGIMRFSPYHFEECREALVQPDISPVVAGDQVAKPLMREFVRN